MITRILTGAIGFLLTAPLLAADSALHQIRHLRDADGRLHLWESTSVGLYHQVWNEGRWTRSLVYRGDVEDVDVRVDALETLHIVFEGGARAGLLHGVLGSGGEWDVTIVPNQDEIPRWYRTMRGPEDELFLLVGSARDLVLNCWRDGDWRATHVELEGALPPAGRDALFLDRAGSVHFLVRDGEGRLKHVALDSAGLLTEVIDAPESFSVERIDVAPDGAIHIWGSTSRNEQCLLVRPVDSRWQTTLWNIGPATRWTLSVRREAALAGVQFDPVVRSLASDLEVLLREHADDLSALQQGLAERFGENVLTSDPAPKYKLVWRDGRWILVCSQPSEMVLLPRTENPVVIEILREVVLSEI